MSERSESPLEEEVRILRAEHANAAFDPQVEDCKRAVRDLSALRCLGQLTNGVFDFAAKASDYDKQWNAPPERVGRELDMCVQDLNLACANLDSGPLIRVVIQGSHGALFHMMKLTGQSLFAFCHADLDRQVDEVDRRLFDILEEVFQRLGIISLNWGGYRSGTEDSGGAGQEPADPFPVRVVGGRGGHRHTGREYPHGRSELMRSALSPDGLHYVALFEEGRPLFAEDILEHPDLVEYFQRSSPLTRRAAYQSVALMCWRYQSRRECLLADSGMGPEVRLVLDVARGALFFVPLGGGTALVGVTLHQNRIRNAEAALRTLQASMREAAPERQAA